MGNLLSLDLSIHERRLNATKRTRQLGGRSRSWDSQADTLQRTLKPARSVKNAGLPSAGHSPIRSSGSAGASTGQPTPVDPTFALFARPRRVLVGSSIHVKLLAPDLQL